MYIEVFNWKEMSKYLSVSEGYRPNLLRLLFRRCKHNTKMRIKLVQFWELSRKILPLALFHLLVISTDRVKSLTHFVVIPRKLSEDLVVICKLRCCFQRTWLLRGNITSFGTVPEDWRVLGQTFWESFSADFSLQRYN